jgi:hypothetical protein
MSKSAYGGVATFLISVACSFLIAAFPNLRVLFFVLAATSAAITAGFFVHYTNIPKLVGNEFSRILLSIGTAIVILGSIAIAYAVHKVIALTPANPDNTAMSIDYNGTIPESVTASGLRNVDYWQLGTDRTMYVRKSSVPGHYYVVDRHISGTMLWVGFKQPVNGCPHVDFDNSNGLQYNMVAYTSMYMVFKFTGQLPPGRKYRSFQEIL